MNDDRQILVKVAIEAYYDELDKLGLAMQQPMQPMQQQQQKPGFLKRVAKGVGKGAATGAVIGGAPTLGALAVPGAVIGGALGGIKAM